ncbi:hypothetical protein J8L73_14955 [Pseudoalteromonas sp. MMG006]|uniref:hypothetical protein n=1 Tax=Pseudoalteromonas sp. MMG006 TaxID=2822683 RepID=UPI001B3870CD|nr:hypothetical protein [Pseudoalteromonas sp. MMG006]MBQ4800417.1 hypothetical protein [Pseudoalteromonas sp. MMG006]
MPVMTLKAGEEQQRPMGARWLSIVEASTRFKIEGEFGSLVGEVGRVIDTQGYNQVTFKNESAHPIELEYEASNLKVYAAGKGVVSISNAVEVSRIREAIQVNANATVENGKMAILPSNNFEAIPTNNTVISAGQTVKVFAARNSIGRSALIQVISEGDEFTPVRVGASPEGIDNAIFLSGNKNNPASYELETQTAVYVKNTGENKVTLAGGEKWRE